MIIKFMQNSITGFRAYIGLTEVSINIDDLPSNKLVALSEYIDKTYDNPLFQVLNSNYILNSDHIYSAIYFTYNAFLSHNNISKSKEIELLLYLSANRQISSAIRDIGLQYNKNGPQNYTLCIVSLQNNIKIIYRDLNESFKLKEVPFELDKKSFEKYNQIKKYFNISDHELKVILKSYEINNIDENLNEIALSKLYLALTDSIREKMVLLSIEKSSLN